jgi:hypothetical protein
MEFSLFALSLILGSVIILSVSWLIRAKISQNDPKNWKQKYEATFEDVKYWRGKYNAKMKQVIELDNDYQINDEGDAGIAISALADSIAPMLPAGVQKLIKNPETLGMIANFAGKHPEIVNKILGGLSKSKSQRASVGETEPTGQDFA